MTRRFALRALSLMAMVLVAMPLFAGRPVTNSKSMTMTFFSPPVNEEPFGGCTVPNSENPGLTGDACQPATAAATVYSFLNSPWTPYSGVTGVSFADGNDCNPTVGTCLSVSLDKNLSTLSIDTRGSYDPATVKPRYVSMNFNSSCPECPYGGGPVNPFGSPNGITNMPALLSVFISTPFPNMAVCSSITCPEGESGVVRLWFDDPNHTANLSWRLEWNYVRVLRMSANTWYVVGSGCDGSQVATLYRLSNNHKNVTTSRQGSYKMPFLISGVQ
jgi:hypothetical protein